jgi:very-short-patch-repair endonuclease
MGRGGGERSKAGELLAHQLNELMRLGAIREYHMANIDADARGWRFDFGFPDVRLLVELHGALGSGKHSRKAGQTNDLEKANAATEAGWSVLSYSTAMVNSGEAALQIERTVLARRRLLASRAV